MSSIKLESNPSGSGIFTIASPNSNTNRTLTLPDATGTIITTAGGAAISGTTGAFTTTVGVGGATPAASGAGITFPATASASSDANTLDDYEEGTWTPTGNGISFSSATGTYTKVGRIVTVTYDVTFPSTANGGQARLQSLPFTPSVGGGGSIGYCEETTVVRTVNDSNAQLYFYNSSNAIVTNATCSTDRIWGTHTYVV